MQHVNMNLFSIYKLYFLYSELFLPMCFSIFLLWKFLLTFVYVIIYCVGAGITALMSISDKSDPYFFRQKMEKTRSMKEEMDGEMFISRQSRHLFLYK